jgi:hypothetical protein
MWLLHLSRDREEVFSFSDPWVWTAIVALAVLMLTGGAILGRHAAAYAKLLAATPDGPIPAEVRAATFATSTWVASHLNTALAIAVVLNMVAKPSDAAVAVTVVVAGMVVGALIGLAGVRGQATATA